MNTEQQLAQYAGWFIPLKMNNASSEYREWRKKYPGKGRTIPKIFILRADGELLYGKSGTLPGAELYQVIETSLQKSGKILSDKQLNTVQSIVQRAKTMIDAKNYKAAVRHANRLKRFGPLGAMNSYATSALEADQLVGELAEVGKQQIASAKNQLANSDSKLQGAIALLEAKQDFGQFLPLKEEIRGLNVLAQNDSTNRESFQIAEQLLKIRSGSTRSAILTARNLIGESNFELDESGEMAIELLQAKLASDPKSKARSTRYPWVSRSGKRVEAALIQFKTNDEKAVSEIEIRRTDGKTSKVRINQLDLVSQQIAHVVAKVRSGKTDNQAPTNKPENANTNP